MMRRVSSFLINPFNQVDLSYYIKNLDTGEQFDSRDETHVETMLGQLDSSIEIKQSNKWSTFWTEVKEAADKLLDAGSQFIFSILLAEIGNLEIVQQLLSKNEKQQLENEEKQQNIPIIDINARSLDGWTALHYAVSEGHYQIVQALLNAKAKPNLETSMKRTPLHIACLRNNLLIIELLIKHPQVDVNCQDSDFNTPLHIAAERGLIEIVQFLLENNADPTIENHQKKTAYDLTLSSEVRQQIKEQHQQFKNYDPKSKYERSEIGGIVVPNSRSDHVQKLLGQIRKIDSGESPVQKNSPVKKNRSTIFQRIQISIKQNLGPDDYNFHKLLGKGSFGEVYLASLKHNKNELYAIKILNKEKVFAKNLTRYAQTEKNVLSFMKHPFIVKLHAAFQNEYYCPGGDLGSMLCRFTRFSEEVARFYICEIILALESLHKNCIIFRDLKPDNVVIDPKGRIELIFILFLLDAKLTDFGLSKEGIYNNITKSFCGSIAYLSPEVLLKRGHSRTVDWYLLGEYHHIIAKYSLLLSLMKPQNRDQLFDNIKRGPLRIPKTMSEDAKDLIKSLLIRDPTLRLGAVNDAEDIKKHNFFKNVNWNDVEEAVLEGPYIEKDRTERFTKEILKINFDGQTHSKIHDWSFVNS